VNAVDPLKRFKINRPIVVDEVFDDEVVIIHFDTGNYYSLDSVGTEIWGLIESGASVSEIVASLTHRYDGSAEVIQEATNRFVAELSKEDLLAPANSKQFTAAGEPGQGLEEEWAATGRPFQAPVISRYTDMQDLLLLDPIHEVDDDGWPSVKPDVENED
jgi:hypothetical protein